MTPKNKYIKHSNQRIAVLEYAELINQDLRSLKLKGSNLEDAKLMWSDLRGMDLEGANFRYANCRYAKFEGANLSRVRRLDLAGLKGATYDSKTKFPKVFSPRNNGMVRVSSKKPQTYNVIPKNTKTYF